MGDVWMTNNGWQPSLLFELRHLGFVRHSTFMLRNFINPAVLRFRALSHLVAES